MIRLFKFFGSVLIALVLLFPAFEIQAAPTLKVDIDEGKLDKHRIEILQTDFLSGQIVDVIEKDFRDLPIFAISVKNFQGQILRADERPNFQEKLSQRYDFFITFKTSEIEGVNEPMLRIEYRIWDIARQIFVEGKALNIDKKNWRIAAHEIADRLYELSTGDMGYFNTKILYVSEDKKMHKTKRIALMDLDGQNHQFVTSGEHDALNPRISDDGSKILYVSYSQEKPKVYLFDMARGSIQPISGFEGMTSAARFSHSGRKAVLAESKNGNTNIYEFDLEAGRKKTLTQINAISTSPFYSPDKDKDIIFNSDVGGRPAIYRMFPDGTGMSCITSGSGSYFTPVYSPDGKKIAFTKRADGNFYIGIMDSDGSNEKILISADNSGVVEAPSWAPNGRLLVFSSLSPVSSESSIFIVDISGKFHKRLSTPYSGAEPVWFSRPQLVDQKPPTE